MKNKPFSVKQNLDTMRPLPFTFRCSGIKTYLSLTLNRWFSCNLGRHYNNNGEMNKCWWTNKAS